MLVYLKEEEFCVTNIKRMNNPFYKCIWKFMFLWTVKINDFLKSLLVCVCSLSIYKWVKIFHLNGPPASQSIVGFTWINGKTHHKPSNFYWNREVHLHNSNIWTRRRWGKEGTLSTSGVETEPILVTPQVTWSHSTRTNTFQNPNTHKAHFSM